MICVWCVTNQYKDYTETTDWRKISGITSDNHILLFTPDPLFMRGPLLAIKMAEGGWVLYYVRCLQTWILGFLIKQWKLFALRVLTWEVVPVQIWVQLVA